MTRATSEAAPTAETRPAVPPPSAANFGLRRTRAAIRSRTSRREIANEITDDDEADLAALVTARASFADLSARLFERGGTEPEQRVVELLLRWIDAETLAS